ncbi:unnamed protein product, partial [Coregonus sp. 'balchen']
MNGAWQRDLQSARILSGWHRAALVGWHSSSVNGSIKVTRASWRPALSPEPASCYTLNSNFSSEASRANIYGPHSQAATAEAAVAPPATSSSSSSSPPSSSAFCPVLPSRHIVEWQPRMLNFRVEYRQRAVEVVVEEGSTVGEIKQILETELQVPISKMQLKGWKSGDVSDSTVLRSLHLPKNNSLYVLTPDIAPTASTSQNSVLQESLNQNFLLVISHREAQRDYNLNFPGSRTIQE